LTRQTGLPGRLLRVVVVRRPAATRARQPGQRQPPPPVEAFFTTALTRSLEPLLAPYRERWAVAVSREGSLTQSVQVRPRLTDSGLVAREAPGRESQPVKPSDNPRGRERAQRSRLQRAVNAEGAS
jgi:hypothetical protein